MTHVVTDVMKERIAFNFSIKHSDCLTSRLSATSQMVSDCTTLQANPEVHTVNILSRATLSTCVMDLQKLPLGENYFA
jgi:hypothetical protein